MKTLYGVPLTHVQISRTHCQGRLCTLGRPQQENQERKFASLHATDSRISPDFSSRVALHSSYKRCFTDEQLLILSSMSIAEEDVPDTKLLQPLGLNTEEEKYSSSDKGPRGDRRHSPLQLETEEIKGVSVEHKTEDSPNSSGSADNSRAMASVCLQPYVIKRHQDTSVSNDKDWPHYDEPTQSGCGEPPPLIPILSRRSHRQVAGAASSCAQQAIIELQSISNAPHPSHHHTSQTVDVHRLQLVKAQDIGQEPPASHKDCEVSTRATHHTSSAQPTDFAQCRITRKDAGNSHRILDQSDWRPASTELNESPNKDATPGDSKATSFDRQVMAHDLAMHPRAMAVMSQYQSHMEKRIQERRRALQQRLLLKRASSFGKHGRVTSPTTTATTHADAAKSTNSTSHTHLPTQYCRNQQISPSLTGPACRPLSTSSIPQGNHFTHLFSQQEISDGFDPNRASGLQAKLKDDPATRRLPDGKVVFGCNQCEESFVWRRHLERHFETHRTKNKGMLCRLCGKCFTRPDHLNRHCSTAHGCQDLPCQLCGEVFQRASHLDRHWLSTHKADDFLPKCCPTSTTGPDKGQSKRRGSQRPGGSRHCHDNSSEAMSADLLRSTATQPASRVTHSTSSVPMTIVLNHGKTLLPLYQPRAQLLTIPHTALTSTNDRPRASAQEVSAAQSARASPLSTPSSPNSSLLSPGSDVAGDMLTNSANMNPFSCTNCGRHFARRQFLKAHISIAHSTAGNDAECDGDTQPTSLPPLIKSTTAEITKEEDRMIIQDYEDSSNTADVDCDEYDDNDDICSYTVECSDTECSDPFDDCMSAEGEPMNERMCESMIHNSFYRHEDNVKE
ncbi:uncharacterized protein LOC135821543 isoform X1 [Sycon ciliatum]|uniref:uncharacterized protein LOC135821543 isoform X1 n=2 Tax=Sycon ciliatum TaxID=27933 RepID=UPI0031F7060F